MIGYFVKDISFMIKKNHILVEKLDNTLTGD